MEHNISIMKKLVFIFLFAVCLFVTGCSKTETITSDSGQYVFDLVINNQNIEHLNELTLYSSSFYNFDLFLEENLYSLCKIDLINKEGKVSDTRFIQIDDQNHFKQKLYLNAKLQKLSIAVQNKETFEFKNIYTYELQPAKQKKTPLMSYDKKTDITTFTVDHTNIDDLPNHLQTGKIYTFDINLPELEFEKATYRIIMKDTVFPEMPMVDDVLALQPNGHYVKTVLLPEHVQELSIDLTGSYWKPEINAAFFRAEPSKKPAKLKIPESVQKAKSYLKNEPDQRIISYLEQIDARNLCKADPDGALVQFVAKIQELTQNPYERVVLIHDTIWYLLAYDVLGWEQKTQGSQEYQDVLKRGSCVCEGFSKVFTQMCILAGIPCCEVRGNGFDVSEETRNFYRENRDKTDFLMNFGHQWNIVMVENCWYVADLTWNCCRLVDGKRTDFYMSGFLFSEPKNFLKRHYPHLAEFQLVKNPVSMNQLLDYIIAGDFDKDVTN